MSDKITVPMSKADLLDKLARIMRDRAYPEFGLTPPPLWAADAAETILALFEDLTKLALSSPETTPAPDDELRAALLHVTTRRHKFTAKCDGCWNARELTRAALALPQPGERPAPGWCGDTTPHQPHVCSGLPESRALRAALAAQPGEPT